MTAYPTVITEVSWTTDPDAAPAWVDIDSGRNAVQSLSTTRGREFEQNQVAAGTLAADLDDASGDFTADNAAGAYYPNVDTDKAIRQRVTPPVPHNGTTYGLFYGTLEGVPTEVDTNGFDNPVARFAAVDDFKNLNLTELLSAFDHEILRGAPQAYYPLSDAAGSSTAGDISSSALRSASVTYSGVAGGFYKFGGNAQLTADPGTSLELAPATDVVFGSPVTTGGPQIVLPPTAYLPAAGAFSIRVTLAVSAGLLPSVPVAIEQWDTDGQVQFRLLLADSFYDFRMVDASGTNLFCIDDASTGSTTAGVWSDGLTHSIVCTVSANRKTFRMYVDGALTKQTVQSTAAAFTAATAGLQVGSASRPGGAANSWLQGRVSKVAVYARELTSTEVLAQYNAENGFAGELSGARIARILDYAGFPAGRRALDAGESVCGPLLSRGVDALQLLTNVTATESGVTFMSGAGNFTFFGRARTRNTTSRVTLGTATLPIESDGMRFDRDNSLIRNYIKASRPNGPTIILEDTASKAKHRRRTSTKTYEVSTDYELYCAAYWDLYLYAWPRTRMSTVVLDPYTAPALWPWALGLEIGDRITLTNLPPGAPTSTMDFIVQKVSHASDGSGSWRTTLLLSPVVAPSLVAGATTSSLTALDTGLLISY